MASAAAERTVRVTLLDSVPAPVPRAARQAPTVPGGAADDAIRAHPLVRRVSELFDASVVRVEVLSTLASAVPAQVEADDADASAGESNV